MRQQEANSQRQQLPTFSTKKLYYGEFIFISITYFGKVEISPQISERFH